MLGSKTKAHNYWNMLAGPTAHGRPLLVIAVPEEQSPQSRPGPPGWSAAASLTPPPSPPAGLLPVELPTPPEMMQTDLCVYM